ncbi:glycine/betaine ABC transporter substrate-binding protein [Arthrobacter sp. MYb211]|uniref:glycine betaine ABC transporter substrate-binding protein n=1 Tax=unclassified Arthrobacter TaxID=235627 RepID=UPI000CFDC633|nr:MULTISPECIES: glycine betaine ABC transporter substrate-binding protein [unclassified Arthrobacter]PRA06882.1 glycine/betaine ABC transporter substrate-binding protein [Arthrobacter sp. MYb229]PRA14022.1 glycine/betaine ABC transporter substrate-binding protein [Arthrobacter sp. MYb221]PRB53784.1 glycine/betaine ABC transporter substrate-binding protein [Arthrobacter sp. MYb216]PRC06623.1 glycine/betaine ABC transporter substrate-binding protein [Arthrobacter sp. MYb211]
MKRNSLKVGAVLAASALALTACGNDGGSEAAGEDKKLNIAVFNGWDEGIASSELWKAVLEEKGYEVELTNSDVAPLFQGLSSGDYDLTTDVWLPVTHASYLEDYGDDIEDLGAWNTESRLTVAVNEDAPIDSLDELAANADKFNNRIVGIEPGAGLTEAMNEAAIPEYGLDDMEFLTSSTSAMLTELETATKNNENIVVTLWEPHWAYSAYPVKNLEDPKGSLGDAEGIHTFSRAGFADDHAEVAKWMGDFKMDLETLYDLENLLFVENDTDDYQPLVKQWMEENREFVDGMTS